MKEIATDLFLLRGFPPAGFNVYVIRSGERWLLVDTSTKYARRRILRQLPGELEAIFITHAHRDHAGSMHAVARRPARRCGRATPTRTRSRARRRSRCRSSTRTTS